MPTHVEPCRLVPCRRARAGRCAPRAGTQGGRVAWKQNFPQARLNAGGSAAVAGAAAAIYVNVRT